jgi:hypothetical protein
MIRKKRIHHTTPPTPDPDVERYREAKKAKKAAEQPPTPSPSTAVPIESYQPTPPSTPPLYVIHETAEEVERHKAWKQGLGDYLTYFAWDVYSLLTFGYWVDEDRARRVGQEFVGKFGASAFAFIAVERGDAGGRVHLHLLIGGLRTLGKSKGGRKWEHGLVKSWSEYNPRGGAAWYVSKWPESSEFVGRLVRRTRRPTRRRKPTGE